MRSLLGFTLIALILTGCLGKMEKVTEDTRDTVKQTHEGQILGTAISIMSNTTLDRTARISAAETVIAKSTEDRLMNYLGMARGDFKSPSALIPTERGVVHIPNVSYVGDINRSAVEDFEIVPSTPDLHDIFYRAVSRLTWSVYMVAKEKLGTMDEASIQEIRQQVPRLLHVTTAVVGAMNLSDLKGHVDGANRKFVNRPDNARDRKLIAERLQLIVEKFGLAQEMGNSLKVIFESRLNVPLKD